MGAYGADRPCRAPPADGPQDCPTFISHAPDDKPVSDNPVDALLDNFFARQHPGEWARAQEPQPPQKPQTPHGPELHTLDAEPGKDQGSKQSVTPAGQRDFKDEARLPQSSARPVDLRSLQGIWFDVTYGSSMTPVATVDGSFVCWNQSLFAGHHHAQLFPHCDGGVFMEVGSASYSASCCQGIPACLVWSDGAIWTRDELQGTWADQDGKLVGVVRNGLLHWSDFSRLGATLHPIPVVQNCAVSLRCSGEADRQAIFQPGPPAQLTWEDGAAWTRLSLDTKTALLGLA